MVIETGIAMGLTSRPVMLTGAATAVGHCARPIDGNTIATGHDTRSGHREISTRQGLDKMLCLRSRIEAGSVLPVLQGGDDKSAEKAPVGGDLVQ